MNTKLVIWTYDPDVTLTDDVRGAHVEYLKALIAEGTLLAAGPRSDVAGGVLLFADTADTADETLADVIANDPFTPAGVIATTAIIDWTAGLGVLAATV